MRKLLPLLLASLATACDGGGSGGGSGGGGPIVAPTPTPSPAPSPTPTPTPSSFVEAPSGADFATSVARLYTVQPNIGACQPGQLNPGVGTSVLATLNAMRAVHGLPPVTYASTDEPGVMQASLMIAANGQLSHDPPPSWLCFTAAGRDGAANSNIYLGQGSGLRYSTNEDLLAGWLTDVDNLTANNIGHRRWLLYPFLSSIAYGRVAGSASAGRADAATIRVINSAQATPASLPDFIAWPYGDYPVRWFDNRALLSFGVIANKASAFGANASVDFSTATISVRQRGGAALAVTNVSWDNQGFGLPNNLQWSTPGLVAGVTYDVAIAGVRVSGATRSYSYSFRLVS